MMQSSQDRKSMLTPAQFTSRWQSEVVAKDPLPDSVRLLTAPAQRLASTRLPEPARRFLAEAGLPEACAPCLSFEEVGKGLPRIWELFSPGQWQPAEKAPLEHYLMLGPDGSGNPICVDERDGKVVMVDHELLFDPKAVAARIMFVNSGIPELAECLLLFHTATPQNRQNALKQADPPAVAKGAFWSYEANSEAESDDNPAHASPKKPWWKLW